MQEHGLGYIDSVCNEDRLELERVGSRVELQAATAHAVEPRMHAGEVASFRALAHHGERGVERKVGRAGRQRQQAIEGALHGGEHRGALVGTHQRHVHGRARLIAGGDHVGEHGLGVLGVVGVAAADDDGLVGELARLEAEVAHLLQHPDGGRDVALRARGLDRAHERNVVGREAGLRDVEQHLATRVVVALAVVLVDQAAVGAVLEREAALELLAQQLVRQRQLAHVAAPANEARVRVRVGRHLGHLHVAPHALGRLVLPGANHGCEQQIEVAHGDVLAAADHELAQSLVCGFERASGELRFECIE